MSDVRYDDDPVDVPFDAGDFILREQQRTTARALGSLSDDPEKAARAKQLSDSTGIPAPVVLGNLDNYEAQNKAALTAQLLSSNGFLRDYIDSDPIAASISNDDYGQLDAVSAAVQKHNKESILVQTFKGFGSGFAEGFGPGGVGSWIPAKDIENYRLASAIWSVVGAPVEGFFRGVSGIVHGAAEGTKQAYLTAGGSSAWAERAKRDVIAASNALIPELMRIPELTEAVRFSQQIRPYYEARKEPPTGLHPVIDEIKSEQAKVDSDNLSEALKEAQKSATRERNPDMFAEFIRKHTDGDIGVSADAVRALYGDKAPTPDDGILGWVPRLQEQLALAEASGGDVRIPIADWLARVEPDVAKQLQDHIRVRESGVSLEEAKVLPEIQEAIEVYHGSPYEFEAFDLGKIGTGEGAQTYGHGLYFAENPEVASSYQKAIPFVNLVEKYKQQGLSNYDALKRAEAETPQGQFYKARILRSPEEFLDWDKPPYGDQRLQAAFQEANMDISGVTDVQDALNQLTTRLGSQEATSKLLAKHGIPGIKYLDQGSRPQLTRIKAAQDIVDAKRAQVEADPTNLNLREALRVLEEGLVEEKTKPQTSNYVVFSDKDIEITHRNGEALQEYRKSHGLEGLKPSFTIERIWDQGFQAYPRKAGDNTHAFSIKDSKGIDHGVIYLAEEAGGKRLYVDDIQSNLGARSLGPRAMREVLAQIKAEFPNAETLDGMRVTGARARVEDPKQLKTSIDLTKIKPRAKPAQQLELDVTRLEDKDIFEKANAIGMTVDQYGRYQKLIEKRRMEDAEAQTKRLLDEERKRQTREWKEAEASLRPGAVDVVNARPEVALDNYLRNGILYGEKVGPTKIGAEYLSAEQQAALKGYHSAKGSHPDDIASLVGYPSGADMIRALENHVAERAASGLRPEDFKRAQIAAEVERQMQERFGKLEQNIIEEVKDRILSQTQLDLLHEETLALAARADAEFSITKDELKSWIDERIAETPVKDISSDRFLADAGRAGREAELALLKEKPADAFKHKQRQYIALEMANRAREIEKTQARFEKLAKKYSKAEVKTVDQAYTNYIQSLLSQAGVPIKLRPDEIVAALKHEGYASLADFVADKSQMGYEPEVSAALQASEVKPIDKMTVAEFQDLVDAVTSLDHIGRQEKKIDILGEKLDWEDYRSKVISNLRELPVRPRESQGRWLYKLDASLTRMEEIVKDLDLRQELGPIFNAVIVPMMQSKAKAFDMMQDLANHFKATKGEFGRKWRKSLNDSIPQDFMIDPYTQAPMDMTRENLINVMLYWGNRSNIEKLTRGYASIELGRLATKEEALAFEAKLKTLIDTHARPEDWQFVSRMWEPFKKFQPMIDTVSRNVSGIAPRWIKPEPVVTPHGTFEGGYWPVKYDKLGSDISVIEDKAGNADGVFGKQYFRAATAKGYLKERTGYVDFVDLNTSIEQAAGVMQQTIHDIAFRDSLIQASKVFYDKPIRAAIRKHYGTEYEAQLIPWLKRIANQYTSDTAAISGINDFLRRVRINLVGHTLPLNLKVILSPDIGVPNPKAWAVFESNRAENVRFAMEHSNEIRHLVYNMDRDFREQLEHSIKDRAFEAVQAKAVRWGFLPAMKISQEFRMSTFIEQYNRAKAEGRTDFEASQIADSFVRERHGAASIVDLPAMMESGEGMKMLTTFYGYFNTMYNWQRQLPGNVRRREAKKFMVNGLGSVVVGAAFGAALFNDAKEGDSWWKIMGKALLLQPLQTIPLVRDVASFAFEGYPSRTPFASLISAAGSIFTDAKKLSRGESPEKLIQHTANIIGLITRLPLAQIGRTAQFGYDVNTSKQRPRNIGEWARGIIYGEARLKK